MNSKTTPTPPAATDEATPTSAAAFTRPVASGVVLLGLSVGNSYYKKKNIVDSLQKILGSLSQGWTVRPFIPEKPLVWTYLAVGYSHEDAQRHAIHQSKKIRRYGRAAAAGDARYIDGSWDDLTGGDANPGYVAAIERLEAAYVCNDDFRNEALEMTRSVLERRGGCTLKGLTVGRRYIIEEFACLSNVRDVLGVDEVVYVYHKPSVVGKGVCEGTRFGLTSTPGTSIAVVNAESGACHRF